MEPGGDSESWAQAQTNQMRIADLCLEDLPDAELKARTGPTWASAPEEEVATELLFGYLATFVSSKYTIEPGRCNAGKMLGIKTALAVFSGVLNQSAQRFSSSSRPETQVTPLLGARTHGGGGRSSLQSSAPPTRARAHHAVLAH